MDTTSYSQIQETIPYTVGTTAIRFTGVMGTIQSLEAKVMDTCMAAPVMTRYGGRMDGSSS